MRSKDVSLSNFCLIIEYDGSGFLGWQKQKEGRTVQGVLEEVLERIFKKKIEVKGQGRMDAGVHALGQVANFFAPWNHSLSQLKTALNSFLPEDIRIREVKRVSPSFHSRFSALSRTYIYLLWEGENFPVFLRNYVSRISQKLNLSLMKKGAVYLLGRHDFTSFSKKGEEGSKVRTLKEIDISRRKKISLPWGEWRGSFLLFRFKADAFLHQMVRIIVGTLVEVGRRKIAPERIREILSSRDRTQAGPTFPPQGLYLVEVEYEEF